MAPALDSSWVDSVEDWVSVAPGCVTDPSLRAGMSRVTADQARRIATAAQGFAGTLPRGPVTGHSPPPRRTHPGAAARFGVGGCSGSLRAGVQQAGPLRPGGARWGGVESQCPGSPVCWWSTGRTKPR